MTIYEYLDSFAFIIIVKFEFSFKHRRLLYPWLGGSEFNVPG